MDGQIPLTSCNVAPHDGNPSVHQASPANSANWVSLFGMEEEEPMVFEGHPVELDLPERDLRHVIGAPTSDVHPAAAAPCGCPSSLRSTLSKVDTVHTTPPLLAAATADLSIGDNNGQGRAADSVSVPLLFQVINNPGLGPFSAGGSADGELNLGGRSLLDVHGWQQEVDAEPAAVWRSAVAHHKLASREMKRGKLQQLDSAFSGLQAREAKVDALLAQQRMDWSGEAAFLASRASLKGSSLAIPERACMSLSMAMHKGSPGSWSSNRCSPGRPMRERIGMHTHMLGM